MRSGAGDRAGTAAALLRRYRASGADLPFGDPRRGHGVAMEGYFWRFSDPRSGRVLIALCGVHRGAGTAAARVTGGTTSGGAPGGDAWANVALAAHPGADAAARDAPGGDAWANVALAAHPGADAAARGAPGGWVREATLEPAGDDPRRLGPWAGEDGRVFAAAPDRLRVDLGTDARLDARLHDVRGWAPRPFGGSGIAQALPGLSQYWHPHVLGGRVSGTATVGEETIDLAGFDVYAEKNWGRDGFPDEWWWGQAQGFVRADRGGRSDGGFDALEDVRGAAGGGVEGVRDASGGGVEGVRGAADEGVEDVRGASGGGRGDVCVAFAGGDVAVGPATLRVTALVVRLGETIVRLGDPVLSPVRADVGDEHWRLRGRSARWSVELEGAASMASAHVLPVPLPDERATVPASLQHLAGRARLVVRHRGRVVFAGESALAGLEHGGRERVTAELARRTASRRGSAEAAR